jgi:hypothetical protein
MPIKKQLKKISRILRQSSTKLEGVFKTTHFDRLLKKQVLTAQHDNLSLGKHPEAMIRTGMLAQLLQARSQRDFVGILESAANWRQFCGFQNDVPVQSTFSRHWNNENYFKPLDQLFLDLQKLIAMKKVHKQSLIPSEVMEAILNGYLPFSFDATFLKLSEKRFQYAGRGYAGSENVAEFGAKLNFGIDNILNMPINFIPTQGNIHESTTIDLITDDLIVNSHSWLKKAFNKQLNPLIIMDKAYWNKKRFINWTKRNIGFIIPRKRKNLTGVLIEFLDFSSSNELTTEGLVWITNNIDPLSWVFKSSLKNNSEGYDVLTNCPGIGKESVVQLYKQRWSIEEVFKWLKQYLNFKTPLVESWEGFVIHCYLTIILFMLFQYFLALLRVPRWQENLTELWRQLRNGPSDPIILTKLRIPFLYLEGGMY